MKAGNHPHAPAPPVPRLSPPSSGVARSALWLAAYLALWAAAGLLFSTPTLTISGDIPNAPPRGYVLGVILTGWLMRALFGVAAIVLARRFPIRRTTAAWAVPLHLLASVLVTLGKIAFCSWLTRQVGYLPDSDFRHLFVLEFPLDVAAYWVVLGAAHGVDYYRGLRRREREAAELSLRTAQLQEQLTRAQLDVLRAQLQPHFLFNTLHSISALIHENPEAADQMVEQLSDFLRLVLENGGAHEVEFREELALLDRYLAIQRTRFQDRLSTWMDVDPAALDARVPNLILQPLVENAIRYGVERRAEGGSIRIRAARDGATLAIEIYDDGSGPLSEGPSSGTGVGLANARARLQQLYGPGSTLRIGVAAAGGTVVTIRLPYQPAARPALADVAS